MSRFIDDVELALTIVMVESTVSIAHMEPVDCSPGLRRCGVGGMKGSKEDKTGARRSEFSPFSTMMLLWMRART